MDWQGYVLASIFTLAGLACVVLIPFGLPGLWVMVGLAGVIELLDTLIIPSPREDTFGWTAVAVAAGLGLLGEGVELLAGAAGTRFGGGTKRGMWGALLGGILGAIAFTLVLPIPLAGTLLGALIGTFLGALTAEATGIESRDRPLRAHLRAALGGTAGRLAGTLGKTAIAIAIWAVLAASAFDLR